MARLESQAPLPKGSCQCGDGFPDTQRAPGWAHAAQPAGSVHPGHFCFCEQPWSCPCSQHCSPMQSAGSEASHCHGTQQVINPAMQGNWERVAELLSVVLTAGSRDGMGWHGMGSIWCCVSESFQTHLSRQPVLLLGFTE